MDQEEQRHSCRLCSKSFPCGRSLGGHMRSHMSSSSSTSFAEESKLGCGAASNGYGLRENPKKTWRLSCDDGDEEEQKQCRECGKEFQSWRALFGHMRCHSSSHDDKREVEEEEEEEEEGSWSGGGGAAADGEGFVKVPKKKRRRTRRPAAIVGSSSSASEEHEQEDVAISLMMLSRDAGYWGSNPSESSDKNSAILEEDRDRNEFKKPNRYKDGEFYYDSDEEESKKGSGVKKRRKTGLDVGTVRDEDGYGARLGKSRYECATCKKSFHSYQALGGHRASHKRLKGGCCSGGGSTTSLDTDTSVSVDPIAVHSGKAKAGNHQCGVCSKVFASGQALGGHKRSHLVMSSPMIVIEEGHEEVEAVVVMPNLLDLNLPAPVVDDDSSNATGTAAAAGAVDAEFDSWWAGSNLKREAMIGSIVTNR